MTRKALGGKYVRNKKRASSHGALVSDGCWVKADVAQSPPSSYSPFLGLPLYCAAAAQRGSAPGMAGSLEQGGSHSEVGRLGLCAAKGAAWSEAAQLGAAPWIRNWARKAGMLAEAP